jgi:ribosome maturation factor RimP
LALSVQEIVEQTVTGLGYDLVEIERSAGGLLRITIDLPWNGVVAGSVATSGGVPEQFVNVEDCEKVTRQLQFALEVDGAEYKRLEVSSPGIDRPLRTEQDFERFVGHVIDVSLKLPIGIAAAAGQVNATRKKFRGTLERREVVAGSEAGAGAEAGAEAGVDGSAAAAADGGWQIVWSDAPPVKPGVRVSKKRPPAPMQVLGFTRSELREARLAPLVSFNGRSAINGAGRGGVLTMSDDTPITND